jgi:hypothetical protein
MPITIRRISMSGMRSRELLLRLSLLQSLRGNLSPRALGLVTEWATLHRAELMEDWAPALMRNSIRSNPWSRYVLKDIIFASPLEGHRLRIRYEDGVEGIVDLGTLVSFRGIFAP